VADEPAKKAKRKVKNPETFRERALKATSESEKPARQKRILPMISKILSAIFRPIDRLLKSIWNSKLLRWLHKPVRIAGNIIFPKYFRESWYELKKVTWPNWKQSRSLTYAVLIFAVIFGALVAVVDYGLDKLFRAILLK